jgi:amidase
LAPAQMRAGLDDLFDRYGVDVLVHATGSGAALASFSGYPSVLVPAGVNAGGVSVDMSFLGRACGEPALLGYAYAYEQATGHRQLPIHTPPL